MRCTFLLPAFFATTLLLSCSRDPEVIQNDPGTPRATLNITSRISAELTIVSTDRTPGITYGAEIVKIVGGEESEEKLSFETDELDENHSHTWTTSDLQPGMTYSARTYISNGRNRKYSGKKTAATPSTSKATLSDVTLVGDMLTAHIVDNGGRKIEEMGFIAGESSERKELIRKEKKQATVLNGNSFSLPLNAFRGGRTYYIIAYATDSQEDSGYSNTPFETWFALPVEKVTFDITEINVEEGGTISLEVSIEPEDATDKTITWTTSDAEVATVEDGIVTAIKEGTAVITATVGGKTASCTVTVVKKYIPVSSISLAPASLEMVKGDTSTLTAIIEPEDATDKTISWTSSNESIITVDDSGEVRAVGGGKASVTAIAGEYSAFCDVVVTVPVSEITLNPASCTLEEEQTIHLYATILPEDATDKTISWTSSDVEVATVDDGTVTAVKEGSAIITASSGDKSATCEVTVMKKVIAVTLIVLNTTEHTMEDGDTYKLEANVFPENATDKTITWTTSDAEVATVEDGIVTAIKQGKATITAAAGDKSASCTVTVKKKEIAVISVSLNETSLTLDIGQSFELIATVFPEDATNKTVTWASDNPDIASVANGMITAQKAGETTVYAAAGGKMANCTVTVREETIPVKSITIDESSLILKIGDTYTLTASIDPENATEYDSIEWKSSNPSVATVSDGTVTAIMEGSATITASAGGKSDSCVVTVLGEDIAVTSVTLDKTSLTLTEGETSTLVATVLPEGATDKTVTWESSNSSVVTVSNGTVKAINEGSATITASAGGESATCAVTVNSAGGGSTVTSLSVSPTEYTLPVGGSTDLKATVVPSDATVVWSSDNESIAMVSQTGHVIALAAGACKITASSGDLSASCQLSVIIPVTGITLDENEITIPLTGTRTLIATVLPEDATDKTVLWSSSNESIAKVSSNGVVTGISAGACVITAKAGDHSAICNVGVGGVPINEEFFPDSYFREFINESNYDKNGDGVLSDDEIAVITQMTVGITDYYRKVSSLAGIEYFTALVSLNCGYCQLSSLDVRHNVALKRLVCKSNPLMSLDLSYCPSLEEVDCTYDQLTILDLTSCTSITTLDCSYNKLTSLELSSCQSLKTITCTNNQLTKLELSSCQSLKTITCTNNQLTKLELSSCVSLESLICNSNALTSLDMSSCSSIISIDCSSNKLTGLKLNSCSSLDSLTCYKNQLTSLDLSSCSSLRLIHCFNNLLSTLDVSNCLGLYRLWCYENPYLNEIWLKTGQSITQFRYDTNVATIYYKD